MAAIRSHTSMWAWNLQGSTPASGLAKELEGGQCGTVHTHGQKKTGIEQPAEQLVVKLEVHKVAHHHHELDHHHDHERWHE